MSQGIEVDMAVRAFALLLADCSARVEALAALVGTGSYSEDWNMLAP